MNLLKKTMLNWINFSMKITKNQQEKNQQKIKKNNKKTSTKNNKKTKRKREWK